jgi:GAF domain-containing protein
MAEDLTIISGTKKDLYESIIPQINALQEGESDLVANLANITAALKEQFNWLGLAFILLKVKNWW